MTVAVAPALTRLPTQFEACPCSHMPTIARAAEATSPKRS